MNYLEKIKKDFASYDDFVLRKYSINSQNIYIISIETITSSSTINDFILKKLTYIEKENNLQEYLINHLPCISIKSSSCYSEIINYLVNG